MQTQDRPIAAPPRPVSGLSIRLERPDQPEVHALIEALDAYQKPLYPPECHYGVDVSALLKPDVAFAVIRGEEGAALGCGAVCCAAEYGELKRVFVKPESRAWGRRARCCPFWRSRRAPGLRDDDAGNRHPPARGDSAIPARRLRFLPPFGDYPDDPHSVFMRKAL
ncbi:Uncharacterised protein [Chromobacterium violaceum]|uniref:N-acetyltransferase domain-containing protein n=1 Tax=Chromobacterium violaceum TaxID=536 RepID=A0A447TFX5_CHRVL|nr:Uncharacterised protein [Chromobacterium violaceum]